MKYLICESKAKAMAISRETYIAFVESMGVNYKTSEQPVDAYGVINISNGTHVLVVDTDMPYYATMPVEYKSQLVTQEELEAQGLILFSNDENTIPIIYPPSLADRIDALEGVLMDLLV